MFYIFHLFPPFFGLSNQLTLIQKQRDFEPPRKFLPLAKAIATELRWLPSGASLAAENLLLGKAKNTWTRTFALANAVAQAYEWQLNPTQRCVRPFYCVAQLRKVEDLEPPEARPNWSESKPVVAAGTFVVKVNWQM